jgi:hypothetical protein
MSGRDSFSSSTHGRHCVEPYVMVPRHRRDTFKPVDPNRTYSIGRAYAVRIASDLSPPAIAACAPASRAIGTRYGEHDT